MKRLASVHSGKVGSQPQAPASDSGLGAYCAVPRSRAGGAAGDTQRQPPAGRAASVPARDRALEIGRRWACKEGLPSSHHVRDEQPFRVWLGAGLHEGREAPAEMVRVREGLELTGALARPLAKNTRGLHGPLRNPREDAGLLGQLHSG
ncbi:MAG: hypothetical protein RLZZ265_3102 [Verrucomicrobiota bacterium]